jgi:hypothetical protein
LHSRSSQRNGLPMEGATGRLHEAPAVPVC